MVIDDEADGRELLAPILGPAGCGCLYRGVSRRGVRNTSAMAARCPVSDIGMPGDDRYVLIRRVQTLQPDAGGQVCALALTATRRSEDPAPSHPPTVRTHEDRIRQAVGDKDVSVPPSAGAYCGVEVIPHAMASNSTTRMGHNGLLDSGERSVCGSPPVRWRADGDPLRHTRGSEDCEGMSMRWSLYPVTAYDHRSPQGVRSGDGGITAALGFLQVPSNAKRTSCPAGWTTGAYRSPHCRYVPPRCRRRSRTSPRVENRLPLT